MTNQQALHAATIAPTQFFSNADEIGRIEPGMAADLVLLNANPLQDIRNTRKIEAVMVQGAWVN
jgi:imidazolonepropionase-like amidohydrolase